MFCCIEGDGKDSFRANVQWYWWMIELPGSLQKKATSRYEVFLNRKNYENEIDLETILAAHEVFDLAYLHCYAGLQLIYWYSV